MTYEKKMAASIRIIQANADAAERIKAAEAKKAAYEASPEGKAEARLERRVREGQAAYRRKLAAERAEADAKVASDAELHARAVAALGGAATPSLIEKWVTQARADETAGRQVLRYDHRR